MGASIGSGKPPTARWARRKGNREALRTRSGGIRQIAEKGVKRSVVVEQEGGPLGVVIAGANVHDTKLLAETLDSMVVLPPLPTTETPQHLCLDKGYDNPTGKKAAEARGYTAHIRRMGEEKSDESGEKRYPARRWVVERTMAWLANFRSVLVRYEVKAENYAGLVQLACILIWTRIWHRIKAQT